MTVGELIIELQKFDPSYIVVFNTTYETESPNPRLVKSGYSHTYWDNNMQIQSISKDQSYVEL